jgi:hypothetical protein
MWCDRLDEPPTYDVEPSDARPDLSWKRCSRCGAVALVAADDHPNPTRRTA